MKHFQFNRWHFWLYSSLCTSPYAWHLTPAGIFTLHSAAVLFSFDAANKMLQCSTKQVINKRRSDQTHHGCNQSVEWLLGGIWAVSQYKCTCTSLYNNSIVRRQILVTGLPFLHFFSCCSVLNVKGAMQCQRRMLPDRDRCKCFIELLKFNGKWKCVQVSSYQ